MPIIELIHHYTLHTAPTFCDYPILLPLWQIVIPSLAVANPFLLHNVAALSSMHLAYLCPTSESPAHAQAALHHQDAALKLIRPSINDINAQNASAIFVSAFLVSIFDIASHSPYAIPLFSPHQISSSAPPLTNFSHLSNTNSGILCDQSLFAQDSTTLPSDSHNDIIAQLQTIFYLLRGILAIIEVSEDSIRTGPVAFLLREVSLNDATPAAPDIECALDRVEAFCVATQEHGSCMQATQNLRVAFRNVGNAPARFNAVFKWAITVDDGFLEALRSGGEGALVVVGLFGVLFPGLDGWWWTRGWGKALVAAVQGRVETGEARKLLGWARQRVGCK
jgi:hypothetical protein